MYIVLKESFKTIKLFYCFLAHISTRNSKLFWSGR